MNLLAYVEVHVRVVEGGYHIVMVSALVFIVYLLLWCRLVMVMRGRSSLYSWKIFLVWAD